MLADYGYIAILLVVRVALHILIHHLQTAVTNKTTRPETLDVKTAPYECGMETFGPTWGQFNFRYYFFALLFVIFDIETVFLYPWAVHFKQLKLFGFVEMLIFILILVVGLVWAWKKKVLEWK